MKKEAKKVRKKLERIDAALIHSVLSWDDAQITDEELAEAVEAYRNAFDALGLDPSQPTLLDEDDDPEEGASEAPSKVDLTASQIGDKAEEITLALLRSDVGRTVLDGFKEIWAKVQ